MEITGDIPARHAVERPDHPAIVMAGSGATMTYAELDEHANRCAQVIRAAGLERGDHIALCVENRLEFLPLCWGAIYAGVYFTAISTRLTVDEAAYIVEDCGARVLVMSEGTADLAEALLDCTPGVELRLSIGTTLAGHDSYEEALAAASAEPISGRREGTDMLYSSGTTGRPKGVLHPLPEGDFGAPTSVQVLGQMVFSFDPDAVYLSPAPAYHAAPLRFSLAIHRVGGTVVMMERFGANEALAAIEAHGVTTSQWVPTMFIRLLKLSDDERAAHDVSSLRCAVHAAAPCPPEVKERMIEWWGPVLHEYYAGSEGNGLVYCNSEEWLAHRGTVGKALLGTLHICGPDGDELPVGEEGTIYFESEASFEYHNDPDKTADSRLSNGWSTLGDVGRLDEDGYLYLTDRKAHMIISGGVNIYPQETENVLAMHPSVDDVAVIGVPDEDFGEQVKAVVQPAPDVVADEALGAELIAYCRERLADVKCPRSVDFRDELPRHPTGKLYKRLLRDEYWAGRDSRLI